MNVQTGVERLLLDQLTREIAETALPKSSGSTAAFSDLLTKALSDAIAPPVAEDTTR